MRGVTDCVYHVLNKSIAGYKIFNDDVEFKRMLETVIFYQSKRKQKFSIFKKKKMYRKRLEELVNSNENKMVEIIAYCFMSTHFHLLLRQLTDNGISDFLNIILNSYTRYFNTKHKRKGPLWEARTKKRLIETDNDLLHMTRYVHLNPVTSYLADNPADWEYSSYREYIDYKDDMVNICNYDDLLEINKKKYEMFVMNRKDYQRDLKKMKDMFIE